MKLFNSGKFQQGFTLYEFFIILVFISEATLAAGIVWIAWHFITKFW